MSSSGPWSVGDNLWRKLGDGNHHFGTITRVWQETDGRWLVEYRRGWSPTKRETHVAPADEMYAGGRAPSRPV
ncbi:hypothetical protein [Embleya sp. NPDC020886]|uniref:hypothetical protein n=1 Tax=Embleya sp. NPDC020886 TaxID=3363980 RepID=UPI00379F0CC6